MRAVLVTLGAVVGVLVGLRSAVAIDVAGATVLLDFPSIPVETLGIEWSELAVWPADVQRLGLERLARALAALTLAVVAVATLNVVLLLAESASARRSEMAIRSALGASPMRLLRMLVRELRTLLLASTTLGVTAGLLAGAALRLTWPGGVAPVLASPPADLVVAVTAVLAVALVAHAGGALSGLRGGRSAEVLRSGGRATWDPAAVFRRRALSAVHVAVAATVLVNAWAVVSTEARAPGLEADPHLWVVRAEVDEAARWSEVEAALATIPGIEAESLAAPGALLGLGVRDVTITECGQCSIGMMPTPLWNATSEHHAVGDGFFELAGIELLDGRAITAGDGPDAPLVAVISRRLADVAFEKGEPLGHRLRIGDDLDRWYTVVGIVADHDVPGLGEDARPRGAVYLSAAQRPPRVGRVLLRGDAGAVERAADALAAAGVDAEAPERLPAFLARERAPIRWSGRVMWLLGFLALAAAVHGIGLTALQTTRRRGPELAVRRALGASGHATLRLVLRSRLRTTTWGLAGFLFLGTLASAPLQRAAGIPGAGPGAFGAVGALLLAVSVLASARAVSEAVSVEPRRLID